MCNALLNYGAYAQTYFEYPGDATLTQTDVSSVEITKSVYDAYKAGKTGSSANLVYLGSTLRLESKIMIRHYFKLADNVTELPNGVSLTPYEAKEGVYYYESAGIAAAALGTPSPYTVDGLTINYCPMSYVVTVLANVEKNANATELVGDEPLQNLAKALYLYNQAAVAYTSAN